MGVRAAGPCMARDLLAASYRKLGDLKKFERLSSARRDYLRAIATGRQSLAKTSRATLPSRRTGDRSRRPRRALTATQGETDEARKLFHEAEQLCSELVQSDPENLESRFTVLHTRVQTGQNGGRRASSLPRRPRSCATDP